MQAKHFTTKLCNMKTGYQSCYSATIWWFAITHYIYTIKTVMIYIYGSLYLSTDISVFFYPQLCVEKLLNVRSPSLDTIKMQVYFDMNYTSRRKWIIMHINCWIHFLVFVKIKSFKNTWKSMFNKTVKLKFSCSLVHPLKQN